MKRLRGPGFESNTILYVPVKNASGKQQPLTSTKRSK